MEFDELLDLLEIDSPDEFGDFEQFATLIEADHEIPYECIFKILSTLESFTLVELTDMYFEDILQSIPNDGVEIYTLLDTIRKELIGLAQNAIAKDERVAYVDELVRFRSWYVFESIVHIRDQKTRKKKEVSVSESLALYRLEQLNEASYQYDYSDCLDYEIDEYSLSFETEIDEEYEEILEEDETLYENGLINKEYPVIDGDVYDGDDIDDFDINYHEDH